MARESIFHAAPLDLLRDSPALVLELLRLARGEPLSSELDEVLAPEAHVSVVDPSSSEAVPTHRSADFVALVRETLDAPVALVAVVEVQRRRDAEKRWAWPQLLAGLAARHRAPVELIVLCFDERTAGWAREPPSIGASLVTRPCVLGPRELPHLGSLDFAKQHLELAVLVGLARAAEQQPRRRLSGEALHDLLLAVSAVAELGAHPRKYELSRLLQSTAPESIRATIIERLEEKDMRAIEILNEQIRRTARREGRKEGREEGREEGRLEARAEVLLNLLKLKGFLVDEALEARVMSTRDRAQLDRWVERVLTAQTLDEVFAA